VKYDHEHGTREVYEYEAGWYPSEAPFAKSTRGGDEDTGYVVTLGTNVMDYRSEAWIFDAKRITSGPIARVRIPHASRPASTPAGSPAATCGATARRSTEKGTLPFSGKGKRGRYPFPTP